MKRIHHIRQRRPSRLTNRSRLTLAYGGLFLFAGILLLGLTYGLVSRQLASDMAVDYSVSIAGGGQPTAPPPSGIDTTSSSSGDPSLVRQVAQNTRDNALHTLLTQGGIALAVIGAAATGLSWLIAGRMLRPLHQMTETARRIADAPAADRGLHERIALDGPHDELKELADTFDIMLERLDHSFDGQRRFIANASHELRTPLTLNRALLEVAVYRAGAGPEVRQLGETLLEINARHERLIDGLLLLARSESEMVERTFVDLADIVDHVATQASPGEVTIRAEPGYAPTTGSPILLERLVQNLVENGVRYNLPERGWLHVTSHARRDGSAVLQVTNTGPVVPPYEVPNLFKPFRRLGAERLANTSPGAGLGLSIVRAVARAHDGDVHAQPRDGGGLVVTVTLPGCTNTVRSGTRLCPPDDQR